MFEHQEDYDFFTKLLCSVDENIEDYEFLFDFRDPEIKRIEFNKIRSAVKKDLLVKYGSICMLCYAEDCDVNSGMEIDHLIPLASNDLNKSIRKIPTNRSPEGKLIKTPKQSFGSNNRKNLILACRNCNSFKKNSFLPSKCIHIILKTCSNNSD